MSCDVVKSKSKLKGIIFNCFQLAAIITILYRIWATSVHIYDFMSLSQKISVKITDVRFFKTKAFVHFDYHLNNTLTTSYEKIPYFTIKPREDLQSLTQALKSQISHGFLNKKKEKVVIFKQFPFKDTIYTLLIILSYTLILTIFNYLQNMPSRTLR